MAGNLLMSVSQNERERAIFRSRRMYQSDMDSNIATAEDRGEARGRVEEKGEIALNALQMGMSIADTSRLTGLTEDEIRKLAH